ncbi:MAG: diguanylate cyclase [Anaerolineaceae bacterium]|nr:diguanylate cyclase [Anaerolineaceae bacterium]
MVDPVFSNTLLLFANALLAFLLVFYSLQKREVRGAKTFLWICLLFGLWSLTSGIAMISPDFHFSNLLFYKVRFFFIAFTPVALFAFSLNFTNRSHWLSFRRFFIFLLIPCATQCLIWLQPELFIKDSQFLLQGNYLGSSSFHPGIGFIVHAVYSYLLGIISFLLICEYILLSGNKFRGQAILLLLGQSFLFLASLAKFLEICSNTTVIDIVDVEVLSFIPLSLTWTWAIFWRRLSTIRPIARENVFELMGNAIVVLDKRNRISDINQAACNLLQWESDFIGFKITKFIPDIEELISRDTEPVIIGFEVKIGEKGKSKIYEVEKTSLLRPRRENPYGCLLVFRDITQRKMVEMAEKEQRALAEALRDTAAALNSTLDVNQVLKRLIDNSDLVVPHDAAIIHLLDNNKIISRVIYDKKYLAMTGEFDQSIVGSSVFNFPGMVHMMNSREPLIIPDTKIRNDVTVYPMTSWIRSYVGVPIVSRGDVIGFIHLDSLITDFFNKSHAERLKALADQAAIAITNAALYEETQWMAMHDSLTGLLNRRSFFNLCEKEFQRVNRYKGTMSFIMLDIDSFKNINDTWGHLSGDKVLQHIAWRFQENLRTTDILGRFGGEEFVAMLPETCAKEAWNVAERLRRDFEKDPINIDDQKIALTISAGINEYCAEEKIRLEQIIDRADQALYLAKKSGRNQVIIWNEEKNK